MPPLDEFDEPGRFFEDVPRLKPALQNEMQRHLFDRLVRATHRQGWDWWAVKSAQDGPVRVGRNNDLEKGSASVLAGLDVRNTQFLIKLNKRVTQADEDWQVLEDALVARFERESFAAAFRDEQQVNRPGRWPAEYDRKEPSMSDRPVPLNQILFGPPGTGKTHATIEAALEALDVEYLKQHRDDRACWCWPFSLIG